MKITISYFHKDWKNTPNGGRVEKEIIGNTAKECMAQINSMRWNHDLAKYTPLRIVNVED